MAPTVEPTSGHPNVLLVFGPDLYQPNSDDPNTQVMEDLW